MKSAGLEMTIGSSSKENRNHNTFFVINLFGAQLYEKSSFNSILIKRISVGKKIIAENILETQHALTIGKGFQLLGHFIKIKHQGCSGFIHSSDLTSFIPQLEQVYHGLHIPDFKGH